MVPVNVSYDKLLEKNFVRHELMVSSHMTYIYRRASNHMISLFVIREVARSQRHSETPSEGHGLCSPPTLALSELTLLSHSLYK